MYISKLLKSEKILLYVIYDMLISIFLLLEIIYNINLIKSNFIYIN